MRNFLISILFLLSFSTSNDLHAGKWDQYYVDTLNRSEPCLTAELANTYFKSENETPGLAIDLGAGTGRDTLYLLKNGWRVLATDAEPLALEIITNRALNLGLSNLEVSVTTFKDLVYPENIDLINASLSLPFCPPQDFQECWDDLTENLSIGGRFAGHFFGDRDQWAGDPTMTFHTQEEAFNLFKDHYKIEYFQMEEGIKPSPSGKLKKWHLFHFVAQKIK